MTDLHSHKNEKEAIQSLILIKTKNKINTIAYNRIKRKTKQLIAYNRNKNEKLKEPSHLFSHKNDIQMQR